MNGQIYTVRMTGTHATAITILQLRAAATKPLEVIRAWLTQDSATTAAQERVQLIRQTSAGTMTSIPAADMFKHDPSAPTPGFTAGHTATAEPTNAGTIAGGVDEGFSALNGWLWLPVPEERIVVPAAGWLGMKFPTAPASKVWQYGFTVIEAG